MQYRAEIDGLRTVAVIPVILFHAGFAVFSGGFVGVDVFFVISGYLITSILLNELEDGKFSIIKFYERRARRILPALFLVLTVCLPFAWFWLFPSDLKDFSKSLIGVSLFASNILFWRQSGYFDNAAELKPLLHTWSLGVEEQFYVFFPLFLMLAWRFGKRWVMAIILAVSLLSLVLAQLGSTSHMLATFYLLPTRAWELAIGSLAAFYLADKNRVLPSANLCQVLSLLGLLMIFYGVFKFNEGTPFPSLYALAPTIGAVLIILFARPGTFAGDLLGSKLFVGIGLISYSAYLWHQPLFAFARQLEDDQPGPLIFLALTGAALGLACLSWYFVERPFRQKGVRRETVFRFSIAGTICFISLGVIGTVTNGFESRLTGNQRDLLKQKEEYQATMKTKAFDRFKCFFDTSQLADTLVKNKCAEPVANQRIIIFGDSEAAHYREGALKFAEGKPISIQLWTGASCRAIDFDHNSGRCREFYRKFVDLVLPTTRQNDVVVVSSNWLNTYNKIGNEQFQDALDTTMRDLKRSKATIIIVGATPDFKRNPFDQLIRIDYAVGTPGTKYLDVEDYRTVNGLIKEEAVKYGYQYFDPTAVLCDNPEPLRCAFVRDRHFIFFDGGHLSQFGSSLVFEAMANVMSTGQVRFGMLTQ